MTFTLADIAEALNGQLVGDGALRVSAIAEPQDAGASDLAMATTANYAARLTEGSARAALMWADADWASYGLEGAVLVQRPRYAMSGITKALDPGPYIEPGIHPTAVVHPSAKIAENAAIGPFVVIGPDAVIGANARIASHASIAERARIGDDVLLYQGVRIGHSVKIGDRFIGQPGAVIGGDGFSFVTPEKSGVEEIRETVGKREAAKEQGWTRIHSLGAVTIGDDVEIGANTTIDRGTVRDTQVGSGTKIDNLVMIGHNVIIGRDTLICGHVGIAGSSTIGDRVVLGGKVAVNDNIIIGNDVIAAGCAAIGSRVKDGEVLLGYPAQDMKREIERIKLNRRLPRLFKQVADLQKAVSKPDAND